MPKVDGLSCSIKYNNGVISYITTRGDGVIGQDITWLKDYLQIPKEIDNKDEVEIRGEIYIPKNTRMETNGKPLRNIAAGLVNRKDDKTNCEHLNFVAYWISKSEFKTLSEDLTFLAKDFNALFPQLFSSITQIESFFEEYKTSLREKWIFETDGLVIQVNDKTLYGSIDSKYVVDHHHHYNIALKPSSESAITTLW
jgi:DNA ligase (NAD+)